MTRVPRVPGSAARGFTLVEVMVVVAIVGMLSTIAFPSYERTLLRSKAAERGVIMSAITAGVNDVLQAQQGIPGGALAGAWNPAGAPSGARQPFDPTLAGWRELSVTFEGATYYSYRFAAVDAGATGTATLDVFGVGDLDSDGVLNAKWKHYDAVGYSLVLSSEVPAAGAEDIGTF